MKKRIIIAALGAASTTLVFCKNAMMKKYTISSSFRFAALGAVSTALVFLFLYTQYGDYLASTQTSRVLSGLDPFLFKIEEEIIERNGFVGLPEYDINDAEYLEQVFVDTFEVTNSGVIIINVRHEKPIIVLLPLFDGKRVCWHLIVGPSFFNWNDGRLRCRR